MGRVVPVQVLDRWALSRWPSTPANPRPQYGRGCGPRVPDLYVRPVGGGTAFGVRLQPYRQPDPRRLGAVPGRPRGGHPRLAFASGMAAIDALLRQLRPGDRILIPDDAYGGTYRLVSGVHAPSAWPTNPWPPTTCEFWKVPSPRRPGWCGWRLPLTPFCALSISPLWLNNAPARCHLGGGQHLRHPLPATASRARR